MTYFVKELLYYVKAKNLTIEKLAYQSGISKGGLSEIERGKKSPMPLTILKICTRLGITIKEFLIIKKLMIFKVNYSKINFNQPIIHRIYMLIIQIGKIISDGIILNKKFRDIDFWANNFFKINYCKKLNFAIIYSYKNFFEGVHVFQIIFYRYFINLLIYVNN